MQTQFQHLSAESQMDSFAKISIGEFVADSFAVTISTIPAHVVSALNRIDRKKPVSVRYSLMEIADDRNLEPIFDLVQENILIHTFSTHQKALDFIRAFRLILQN